MRSLGWLCVLLCGVSPVCATPVVYRAVLTCDGVNLSVYDNVSTNVSASCAGGAGGVTISGDQVIVSGSGRGFASITTNTPPTPGYPGSGLYYETTIRLAGMEGQDAWFVYQPAPGTSATAGSAKDYSFVDFGALGARVTSFDGLIQGAVPFHFGVGIEWLIASGAGFLNDPALGTNSQAVFWNPLVMPGSFGVYGHCTNTDTGFSCQDAIGGAQVETREYLNTPEPGTWGLLLLGAGALWWKQKRLPERRPGAGERQY